MPSKRQAWMWTEACECIERVERLHRQFFRLTVSLAERPAWEPPVDVFETPAAVWVLAALPGVSPATVSVGFEGGGMVITGDRRLPEQLRSAAIHRLEVPHGRFERRIELPLGEYELAGQEFGNGLLLVELVKR